MNKRISIALGSLLSAMVMSACTDDVRVMLDIADADKYVRIYMPLAANLENVKTVYIRDEVQSFPVTAYYGGPKHPKRDVAVEFEFRMDLVEAYNELHGTDYKPMPEGSYLMEQTTVAIPEGDLRTAPLRIDILSGDNLTVAEPYLLPIGIKSVDSEVPVEESLRTAYFVITGSYLPGQVPRKKVCSFGQRVSAPIFCRNSDLIRIDEDNRLVLYQPDAEGVYGEPRVLGTGWGGMQYMFYMPHNRFLVRNESENIVQYAIGDDYAFLGQATIGWGWGFLEQLFPFKDKAILAIDGDALLKYPLDQSGQFDFPNCTAIEATGWGDYIHLFAYGNNIIAVDRKGDMWSVPLSDSYAPGTKRKIGTGWDIYTTIIPCEKDLLALDANGDLWRYQFNPSAFWPLKAEEPEEPAEGGDDGDGGESGESGDTAG